MLSSIVVSQRELADAFKTLRTYIRRYENVEAVFTFNEGALTIDVPGIKVRVSGKSSLCGQAYVRWYYLYCVAAEVPTDDPVLIRVEAGRLIIGSTSLPCNWQETIAKLIEMPMDAPLSDILELRLQYDDEQIARSGLTEIVWNAELRMHELVNQAAALLEQFGVEYVEILQLVEDSLKRKNQVE